MAGKGLLRRPKLSLLRLLRLKMMMMILLPYAEKTLGEYQAGFRSGRSTTDQIFTVRQVYEKFWEFGTDLYQVFVNFTKA